MWREKERAAVCVRVYCMFSWCDCINYSVNDGRHIFCLVYRSAHIQQNTWVRNEKRARNELKNQKEQEEEKKDKFHTHTHTHLVCIVFVPMWFGYIFDNQVCHMLNLCPNSNADRRRSHYYDVPYWWKHTFNPNAYVLNKLLRRTPKVWQFH